jgi:hypothetical protein
MHSHCVTYKKQITLSFQKRKKSSYLSSGVPPPTRQLTRSLRTEPRLEEKPPSSSSLDNNTGTQHRRASPQTTTSSTSGSLSLHIPGLPPSLTIERVQTSLCVVCRKPGEWSGFSWLLLIFWSNHEGLGICQTAEKMSAVSSCLLWVHAFALVQVSHCVFLIFSFVCTRVTERV